MEHFIFESTPIRYKLKRVKEKLSSLLQSVCLRVKRVFRAPNWLECL